MLTLPLPLGGVFLAPKLIC